MAADLVAATEQEQAQFFARVHAGYQAACERTGEVVRDFRLAGTLVRLRFAGEVLIPAIVPGLAYPVSACSADARCEICLWDSDSSGIQLMPPPRPWKDFTERGNIWGFDSCRYRSAYQWGEGSVNVMDREAKLAVFWVPTHKHLPAWTMASPLRGILHWWMELNGGQLVHAAAVGAGDRGVLIPGPGGSGKSSTSLACLLAGMDFIADDYLAVMLDPEPRVHRLYTTAKLDLSSLGLYPDIASRCRRVHQPGFDKVVLFLEEAYGERLRESLPLKLVLNPRISRVTETTLGPTEPLAIERALASETLAHLPHAGARTVAFLNRISQEIPGAALNLGTDRARIATTIQGTLDSGITADLPPHQTAERRPFISIIVHFQQEDRDELRTLASAIEAQDYPRIELIVIPSGPACAMTDEIRNLRGNVRVFSFQDTVVNAQAWNRGIRESFAELLIFIEPGDRFPMGTLSTLVNACEMNSRAAWVQGVLRGALVRKSAFRECGLFPTDPFFQRREQARWQERARQKGLTGHSIETVTLHTASAAATENRPVIVKPDLNYLKEELDRRRGKKLE